MVLITVAVPDGAQANRQVWHVRSGEALSTIAARFRVSVDQLIEWNDLDNPDRIREGQRLVVAPEAPERLPVVPCDGPRYRFRRGDTLSRVARRFGTEVPTLLRLNENLRADRIQVGEEICFEARGDRLEIDYEVRDGDTLAHIARRHRVSVRDLHRWNQGLRRRGLREGRPVRIYSTIPESTSESVGACHHGRLEHPEPLPEHPGYLIRDARRAFGTLETVLWIQDAFDAVRARHRRPPRLRIHDISDRDGGQLRDHRSHQSGRDVDISLYRTDGCREDVCPFRRLTAETLDAERSWTLFEHWLREGRVEKIFLDYSLLRPLYEEAKRRGATEAQLEAWFQYPRGRGNPHGIVRHFRRHRDHAHVRFICPDTDDNCR